MSTEPITIDYREAVRAVAEELAARHDMTPQLFHANDARRILWPLLSDEDQARLVMR